MLGVPLGIPPHQAFQGDAAHQVQRCPSLTPKDSPGAWYTRRDYQSNWTLHPFHHTVFTAHTWIALPSSGYTQGSVCAGGRIQALLRDSFCGHCRL
jgi:hypothetical protein